MPDRRRGGWSAIDPAIDERLCETIACDRVAGAARYLASHSATRIWAMGRSISFEGESIQATSQVSTISHSVRCMNRMLIVEKSSCLMS